MALHINCNITFTLPAFRENMLTGGPLLGGAPGPAGPGICAMAGKPVGGGGGGLLCKIIKKTSSGLPVLATIDKLIRYFT